MFNSLVFNSATIFSRSGRTIIKLGDGRIKLVLDNAQKKAILKQNSVKLIMKEAKTFKTSNNRLKLKICQ